MTRAGRCLAAGLALAAACAGMEARADDLEAYLRSHAVSLPPAGQAASLPPGFLVQAGKRLYLLGEVHGAAANNDVDLTLLKTLQAAAGVRTYLAEISYAHSWFLNRFLETGDEALLDLVFAQLRGHTVDASRQKRAFWERMRRWNDGLPASQRVRIAGLDLERFPGISRAYLDLAAAPDEFGRSQAHRNLADHEQAETLHGAAFDAFRDRAMVANFLAILPRLPAGSIYGRLGFAHVAQGRYEGIPWLSYHLSRAPSPWAGAVVSIWPLYWHCRRLAIDHGVYGTTDCSDDLTVTAPLARAAKGGLTLFQLNAPGSPYAQRLIFPLGAEGRCTTDIIQYAVLIKNGLPAEPEGGAR